MKKILSIAVFALFTFSVTYFIPKNNTIRQKKLSKFEKMMFFKDLEFQKTRDPKTNSIPMNIRAKEQKFIVKVNRDYFQKSDFVQKSDFIWSSLGPDNIAGRIKGLEFDIKDVNHIICGSASGGIWMTSNKGASWSKTNHPNDEQSIYCIEQDKRNGKTNTWYCGTGELLSTTNRKFSIKERTIGMGNGIYKSTDNGENWSHLTSTSVTDKSSLNDVFQGIWDIKVDNSKEENNLYAACVGGIMKSTDEGESWELSIGDLQNKCFSSDIDISSEGECYAALSSYSLSENTPQNTGIFRMYDGTWENITPENFPDDVRVIKLKIAPSNPNVVYVFTESPRENPDPFYNFASSLHTFWKYTYNQESGDGTWEDRTGNLPFQSYHNISQALRNGYNSLGGYCFTLNIHPSDENIVLIGGTNLFIAEDGFETSTYRKIGGYSSMLHPDIHSIQFDITNENNLFVGSDGGVALSDDLYASPVRWDVLNYDLVTSQFYAIAFDKVENDNLIIGGLQDNGSAAIEINSDRSWYQILGGDGLSCFVANNKEFVIVSVYNGDIYAGEIDNVGNVQSINSYLPSDGIRNKIPNFFTIFEVEPTDNDELYLAVNNSIYRKTNLKQSIQNAGLRNSYWTNLQQTEIDVNHNVTAMSMSAFPEDILFYGTDEGKVYRVDDVNSEAIHRIDISDDDFPINGYVACIDVDEANADNIYVVFSNYNVQSVFHSSDGGATWSQIGGNLEENPDGSGSGPSIRWIEVLNFNAKRHYFLGTSSGLFYTNELSGVNTNWKQQSPDFIGNIRVDQIISRRIDGKIAIATQGNGVYTTTVSTNIDYTNITNLKMKCYPNPVVSKANLQLNIDKSDTYKLTIVDLLGNELKSYPKQYFQSGLHRIYLDFSHLNSGTYICLLTNQNNQLVGKCIIVMSN